MGIVSAEASIVSTAQDGETSSQEKRHTTTQQDAPASTPTLQRRLKSRHIQFLALAGTIGTGLFIGSGQVLHLAGPLSALLAYAITGLNMYGIMTSLGEMSAWLPVPGAIPVYASRFADPALGFAVAWNYWYQFAIGVPIEATACAVLVDFWPGAVAVPKAALVVLFLATMVVSNCLPVHFLGETEFVFGAVKLLTIVGLLFVMLLITVGAAGQPATGFRFWSDPGPINAYLVPGALGRFLAFAKAFIQVSFSYGGSEIVVVAAGEVQDPRRNIPRAVRRVFWRIGLFYLVSMLLVGLCVPSNDARLLDAMSASAPSVVQSPFVIAVANAGIRVLPSIINAVVLTSAWSAGNSCFYSSTRVLYAAAVDGKAPAILRWQRFGVPYACVAATTAIGCLVFLNLSHEAADVFFWISNLSAVSSLVVWASIAFTYLRFHYALRRQGIERNHLPYKSPCQPFLAYFSLVFCVTVALFNGFDAFFPGRLSAKTLLPPYLNIPIFLGLFWGYKLVNKTKLASLADMDLWSGKAEIDALESTWKVAKPRNWLEKMWFWIA